MTRRFAGTVAAVLLLLGAGCGYRLAGRATDASFLPPDVTRIGIPTFENQTDQADIDQRVTEALIDEFVSRGRRLEAYPKRDGVDAVLEGVITAYRESPVAFTEGGRYSRVEVTVTARIRLVKASPERVLWSQNHFVFREQYDVPETAADEFAREVVAIDDIADGFARTVVTSILEGF